MNILFIGKPGSGKGTITQKLEKDGFIQLSTGDLLRAEVATGSEMGKEIDALLKQGKFATDETIFKIVDNFLLKNSDKSIIFDGYPRNLQQAQVCLDNGINFDKVFLIDVSDDIVKERIVNRRVHTASGRVYNIKTMPPKVDGVDDVTGEPLTHRNDDRAEVLDKRLENYRTLTQPIIDLLKQNNIKINIINGEAPIEEQIQQVKQELYSTSKKMKP